LDVYSRTIIFILLHGKLMREREEERKRGREEERKRERERGGGEEST
jgi:hypothetical protein